MNVVQMVFGNMGDRLGDRRLLHPQPVDRRARALRRVPSRRAGRGRRRRDPDAAADRQAARADARAVCASSSTTIERLERHYRDMQDIEFTIEDGRLYLLQTRSAKRTAAAAVKAAVSMVAEGLIGRDEAIRRIDPAQLDQLLHPMLDPTAKVDVAATGLNASPGAACGRARARRRHGRAARQGRARASSSSAGRRPPPTFTG